MVGGQKVDVVSFMALLADVNRDDGRLYFRFY